MLHRCASSLHKVPFPAAELPLVLLLSVFSSGNERACDTVSFDCVGERSRFVWKIVPLVVTTSSRKVMDDALWWKESHCQLGSDAPSSSSSANDDEDESSAQEVGQEDSTYVSTVSRCGKKRTSAFESSSLQVLTKKCGISAPKRRAKQHRPVYRGVRRRSWGKWVSEIREPKKKSRIWLGSFPTPEMAARAHDVAALTLKGDAATLNFPEFADRLPRPTGHSPKAIQEAAVAAAFTFPALQQEFHQSSMPVSTPVSGLSLKHEEFNQENGRPVQDMYVDEDLVFKMPCILSNMAEALVLAPPVWEEAHPCISDVEVALWEPALWDLELELEG